MMNALRGRPKDYRSGWTELRGAGQSSSLDTDRSPAKRIDDSLDEAQTADTSTADSCLDDIPVQKIFSSFRNETAVEILSHEASVEQDSALRAIQIQAIMSILGHYVDDPPRLSVGKFLTRTIAEDGPLEAAVNIARQLDERSLNAEDQAKYVARLLSEEIFDDFDRMKRAVGLLLFLRYRTAAHAAKVCMDNALHSKIADLAEEVRKAIPQHPASMPSDVVETVQKTQPRLAEDSNDAFIQNIQGLEITLLGHLPPHLTTTVAPLQLRQAEVLQTLPSVLLAVSVFDRDTLWSIVEGLSPTAKQDPDPLVRASTMLMLDCVLGEVLKRDELKRKESEERLQRARNRYYEETGSDIINADWGRFILEMAGNEAEAVPPA